MLDTTRFIAGLGVIWFHSIESDSLRASGVLGRSSVAFYTMAAMIFLVDSSFRRQRPFLTYAGDRLRRLLPPFIAWSVVNFLVLYLLGFFGTHVDLPQLSWNLLADGGTLHLWYLPFLMIASLGVYPLSRWMQRSRGKQFVVAGVAAVIAVALDLQLLDFVPTPHWPVVAHFMDLTSMRWSAIYWGIAAAIVWRNGLSDASFWRSTLAVAGLFILLASFLWQWDFGLSAVLKVYGGLGILLIALAPVDNVLVRTLAPLGRLSPGIYFAHMPAIYLARQVIAFGGGAEGEWARDVATFVLGTAIALTATQALALMPGLRWLLALDTAKSPPKTHHLPPQSQLPTAQAA